MLAVTLMLLLALTGLALSLIPVVADQLRADFGYSDSQIGLLTSVFMLALGVVAIPWGLASARWGVGPWPSASPSASPAPCFWPSPTRTGAFSPGASCKGWVLG